MKLNVTVYLKKKIGSTYFRAAPTGFAAYLPWEKIVPQERTPTISIFVFVSTDKLKQKKLDWCFTSYLYPYISVEGAEHNKRLTKIMFHVLDLNCWFTEKLYVLRLNGIPNGKYDAKVEQKWRSNDGNNLGH